MTDVRQRRAERAGDRVAAYRERLRSCDYPCAACRGLGHLTPTNGEPTLPWSTTEKRTTPCPACAGTGLTIRPRVELAAYCGDKAAREALGDFTSEPCSEEKCGRPMHTHPISTLCVGYPMLSLFVSGLSHWGPRVMAHAAVAAAWPALLAYQRRAGGVWIGSQRCLRAAEAWIADPTDEKRQAWYVAWCPDLQPYIPLAFGADLPSDWERRIGSAAIAYSEAAVREAIQQALIARA